MPSVPMMIPALAAKLLPGVRVLHINIGIDVIGNLRQSLLCIHALAKSDNQNNRANDGRISSFSFSFPSPFIGSRSIP